MARRDLLRCAAAAAAGVVVFRPLACLLWHCCIPRLVLGMLTVSFVLTGAALLHPHPPTHPPLPTAATRAEYASLKAQLQSETFPPAAPGAPQRLWSDMSQVTAGCRDTVTSGL